MTKNLKDLWLELSMLGDRLPQSESQRIELLEKEVQILNQIIKELITQDNVRARFDEESG